ncbi:MAG TPA: FkbM family methyltransferase [Bryobacteraceae bacterium]|nr:FkbM family methyltransferase [Bryobacteraceae bacterium]
MSANDLASRVLLWYTEQLPWHRGKARVVQAVKKTFHLHKEGDQQVTRLGLRWVLNPVDYGEGHLFWVGSYDIWERHHIERLLPKDPVVFDIGTNYGLYSLTLADHLGPTAIVHCFEPNPVTYDRLARNISLNHMRNLYPHKLGLGDWVGTASLVTNNETNSGATSLAEGQGTVITTLDRFCEESNIQRIDFMKVDVEGFEPRLLKGGRKTLERFKPMMQFELNAPVLKHAGSSAEEVRDMLKSLGYEFYLFERERLVPMKSLPDEPDYLINCLCVNSRNRPAGL